MRRTPHALLCAAGLLLAPLAALACGHCLEDRIASVYDHSAVERAKLQKHTLMYLVWDGPLTHDAATRRWLVRTVAAVPGVVAGSVRVSLEPPTIALAFDAARTKAAALESALQGSLASRGATASSLTTITATAAAP